jgi:hypothetical protein
MVSTRRDPKTNTAVDHNLYDIVLDHKEVLDALAAGIDLPALRLRGGASEGEGEDDEEGEDEEIDLEEHEEVDLEEQVEAIGASNLDDGVRATYRNRMFEFVNWIFKECEKAPETHRKHTLRNHPICSSRK